SPFWLEITELDVSEEGDSVAAIPYTDFNSLRIHIRKQPNQVNYGSIFARINTESANIIMTTTSTATGFVCEFDLNRRAGFRFRPGRNSVEIELMDNWHRRHYASFLLQTTTRPLAPKAVPPTGEVERIVGQKYAVVVGISRYRYTQEGIPNLRFADRDATAFRDFLLSAAGGSFPGKNLVFLVNESATAQNLRSALFTFLTRTRPEDLVVLYFAGHGSPDPHDRRNLYLLTSDTQPDDMGGTAFPMWQLQDVFSRIIKARRVVTFTDACHSLGISGELYGAPRQQNNLINQYLARYAVEAQQAVITASDISELSYESDRWGGGHGVFTYFVLQGLGGEADYNLDGTVTAGELFAYVRAEVWRATEGQQNPAALPGLAQDLPLAGRALRAAR
ncbi:MAG: caspase domain-containing protein, partial [Terriglobia bacterium]